MHRTPEDMNHDHVGPKWLDLKKLPDRELMKHLAVGNGDALTVIFDRYHRLVLNVATRIVGDRGEAEDLVQAVFLEILQAAAKFDSTRGTFKVWLLQYAYHRSINRRQYLASRQFYDCGDTDHDNTPVAPQAYRKTLILPAQESARLIEQGLGQLNPAQRTTVRLAHFEGMTMAEIAAHTGQAIGNVRHHYYRGLEKLRVIFGAERKAARPATNNRAEVSDA
jgi:RNA polymerase sigma-70 factor (ECF subfamily)